jgi:hypothetical protein
VTVVESGLGTLGTCTRIPPVRIGIAEHMRLKPRPLTLIIVYTKLAYRIGRIIKSQSVL